MNITIFPSAVSGALRAPASKSQAIRLTAVAMLAEETSTIRFPSTCDDALAMCRIAKQSGAKIFEGENSWEIKGGVKFTGGPVDCGESGLAARLMIALASLGRHEIEVTGQGTLMNRHLGDIRPALESLGAKCNDNHGKLPFRVLGPIAGGRVEVDGSGGSQFVSGLLMALPLATDDSEVVVHRLRSIPYVDMTLEVLEKSGIKVRHTDYKVFQIPGNQKYLPFEAEVEGDWSGAAFPLVAGALAGNITVAGLDMESRQADLKIMDVLGRAGVKYSLDHNGISLTKSPVRPFEFDATHCPDLFPPLAVLAAASDGVCSIYGAGRLSQKESHRGVVLQQELGKLGIRIGLEGDVMKVYGGTVKGGEIFSHNDHRIAMAGAIAGLIATGPVTIRHAGCVSKSWPGFFDDLTKLVVSMKQS